MCKIAKKTLNSKTLGFLGTLDFHVPCTHTRIWRTNHELPCNHHISSSSSQAFLLHYFIPQDLPVSRYLELQFTIKKTSPLFSTTFCDEIWLNGRHLSQNRISQQNCSFRFFAIRKVDSRQNI
jgi:hypothetical protein